MPNNQSEYFTDLMKYYNEFYDRMFGGMDLETAYSKEVYGKQQELLGGRAERQQERVLERLGQQGLLRSGVGSRTMREEVDIPFAEAESALDLQRLESMQEEERRRQGIAMGFAGSKYEEEKAREAERSGFWGRLAGGVLGGGITGFLTGGPMGALAGAGLGATGSLFGGGAGAGYTAAGQPGYNELLMYYLDFLNRGGKVEDLAERMDYTSGSRRGTY